MNLSNKVIGVRKLNSSTGLKVVVTVWCPFKTSHGDFECRYQIYGAGDEVVRRSVGIDGIQAVTLALKKIGSELSVIQNLHSTQFFTGSGEIVREHGFPIIDEP